MRCKTKSTSFTPLAPACMAAWACRTHQTSEWTGSTVWFGKRKHSSRLPICVPTVAWHLLRCWTRLSTCAAVPAHTYPAAAVVPSPLPHQKQYMNAFFFFFFFFSFFSLFLVCLYVPCVWVCDDTSCFSNPHVDIISNPAHALPVTSSHHQGTPRWATWAPRSYQKDHPWRLGRRGLLYKSLGA